MTDRPTRRGSRGTGRGRGSHAEEIAMPTPDHANHTARDGGGRFLRTVDSARRDADAAQLRAAGATYQAIADQLGYADRRTAYRAVEQVLASTVREPAEHLRSLELARLDELLLQAWRVLKREHVTVSHGKVVTVDGEPLRDDGPTLRAIETLLRVMERRAKLLGLDAPARHEVITLDQVDAEIARLTEQLGLSNVEVMP